MLASLPTVAAACASCVDQLETLKTFCCVADCKTAPRELAAPVNACSSVAAAGYSVANRLRFVSPVLNAATVGLIAAAKVLLGVELVHDLASEPSVERAAFNGATSLRYVAAAVFSLIVAGAFLAAGALLVVFVAAVVFAAVEPHAPKARAAPVINSTFFIFHPSQLVSLSTVVHSFSLMLRHKPAD